MKLINDLVAAYVPEVAENEKFEGQGMVEYALILVLVAIAALVVLGLLGDAIVDVFQEVVDTLTG
jgi:pilus assembly protein Flp/PilA